MMVEDLFVDDYQLSNGFLTTHSPCTLIHSKMILFGEIRVSSNDDFTPLQLHFWSPISMLLYQTLQIT